MFRATWCVLRDAGCASKRPKTLAGLIAGSIGGSLNVSSGNESIDVSGSTALSTGDDVAATSSSGTVTVASEPASYALSGSIALSTGSATSEGNGGSILLSVGSGTVGTDGNVNTVAEGTHATTSTGQLIVEYWDRKITALSDTCGGASDTISEQVRANGDGSPEYL
ncbi:unnamed protein product [Phytophthora fragariaefolia]|uniref:Unnamed protein product n=1 Tax=Phytophthora fragariaefolia TaxID=1490495 RepID=A0A9W7D7N3_9STRA|nr:unnamed protein product [Phytophthora fragariaefolia]